MMLYKLLSTTDRSRFASALILLMDKGGIGARVEALGIPVYATNMPRGRLTARGVWRLARLVRRLRPDIIQGWTYHGNIAASAVSVMARSSNVLWNVRHTPQDLNSHKKLTAMLIRLGGWCSRQPTAIIYNSYRSAMRHEEKLGYAAGRRKVIPNGFDVDVYKPSPAARLVLRQSLGVEQDALLIGMVARDHPMKDHANFIHAAARLSAHRRNVHFVLVGRGVDNRNDQLVKLIEDDNLRPRVHLLGERFDMPDITAGLDIASLSSAWGEGFPNVIGEAMACAVPCVVTDVGDSARVVSDNGIVVPPKDPQALAAAWARLIDLGAEERARLGAAARQHIVERYSLLAIVHEYEDLYASVLAQRTPFKS